MLKRCCSVLFALLLFVSSVSFAEFIPDDYSITDATISASSFVDITAPFSGILCSFDWEPGDEVHEGEKLFHFLTTELYAPDDGILSELYTQVGEATSFAMQNYGCLGYLEPIRQQRMTCTPEGANYDADTDVSIGQLLYFKSSKEDKPEGVGKVISRNGSSFVLEIVEGEFEAGEKMTLFLSSKRKDKENIGKGIVVRREPLPINGTGVVSSLYVTAGETIKKGQKLLSLVGPDADPGAIPEVFAACNGILGTIAVTPGQQIWKGGLLCRILKTDSLEIVAQVDEMDLKGLRVGDAVYYALDTDKDTVFNGRVTEISSLGISKGNAAYYAVHVSIGSEVSLMLGQSASLYLPK